ncbi:GIY-YIG nuclease family protein (plasmid) [Lachnospiraceae bacterium C1.1]|nr:GIY-YIG nuclease family protein [Lachnospiraceae bacterium C1.1]
MLYIILFIIIVALIFIFVINANTDYQQIEADIIDDTAFKIVTQNMNNSEIYTKSGTMRVAIGKKVDEEIDRINIFLDANNDEYINLLKEKRLLNDKDKIKVRKKAKIVRLLKDYYTNYRNNLTNSAVDGMTPDDFFLYKAHNSGDYVGVYVIYNLDKDLYYVGQAKRMLFRVNQHFTGHGNGDVYSDYKYGDRFIIKLILLSESGYDDIDKLEKDMIYRYDSYNTGYNRTSGNS